MGSIAAHIPWVTFIKFTHSQMDRIFLLNILFCQYFFSCSTVNFKLYAV